MQGGKDCVLGLKTKALAAYQNSIVFTKMFLIIFKKVIKTNYK